MASGPNDRLEKAISSSSVVDQERRVAERTNNENKSPRHPRWTKQETLILIEGKKIAEGQGRKGRRSSSVFGIGQIEPKWDSVSAYCRLHGVNRAPVQCRKRWSNLASDFKKIKTWESRVKEGQSFWMMGNDLKREKRLPGHFDREVYAAFDAKDYAATAHQLAEMRIYADGKVPDGISASDTEDEDEKEDNKEVETEAAFDSNSHARPEDRLVSHLEPQGHGKILRCPEAKVARESPKKSSSAPMPLSEKQYQQFHQTYCNRGPPIKKQSAPHLWRRTVFQDGVKRRRLSLDGCQDINPNQYLVKALERSANLLNAQLEAQRINSQLEWEQQKVQNDKLGSALSKITDALSRIADNL